MLDIALIAHHQAPIIVHLPEAAFDRPTVTVVGARADRPPALGMLPGPPRERRNRRLDAPAAQITAKLPALMCLIRHECLRACARAASQSRYAHGGQRGLRQLAFVRPGTVHMHSDRLPLAVGDDHDLRALADVGFTDRNAPLFAGTKLPSRKALDQSRLPWASNWHSRARYMRPQVPSRDHVCRSRQAMVGAPYARRIASQVPPVFSTCKTPFRVRRSSARGRPGPGFGWGSHGSMTAHCLSESSCRFMPPI
jgi:hypothetical protein